MLEEENIDVPVLVLTCCAMELHLHWIQEVSHSDLLCLGSLGRGIFIILKYEEFFLNSVRRREMYINFLASVL